MALILLHPWVPFLTSSGVRVIFSQILVSLNSSIGYWQLFFGSLSGNDASCPKPDIHWSFLTGGRGRRCIMNCDSLSLDKPQSIWRAKGASCLPSKSWFCQDSLIADEEAKRKRWCWEEWGRHLPTSPSRLASYWFKQIVRIEWANECFEIHWERFY